ncbi:MAG: RAMP superfamily protein [Parcubacteria group bacterium ADurb.Bin216]|nr:MAG: RAMP superfamily protein [Parcubacteria group bacterium ADurb.Bin216]
MQLIKTLKLNFKLKLLTGLHIGSGNDTIKIGGVDSPVIRNPLSGEPYIPGSSLKGKMRYLLGQDKGVNDLKDADISLMFGRAADKKNDSNDPTRIIVRDLFMTDEWKEKFLQFKDDGLSFIEEKSETNIDRVTCKASPRFIERVPAGVDFSGSIVLRVFQSDSGQEEEMKQMIEKSLILVENDALGGSGSRGYGQVQIIDKTWE